MDNPQRPPIALSARDLQKTYKAVGNQPAKEALKGIDLDIPRGAIFGLLGPMGRANRPLSIFSPGWSSNRAAAPIFGDLTLTPIRARRAPQ